MTPPPRVLTQCAPLPSLAQERPGDTRGMPEQTCFCHHLKHPPARPQSGPEEPLGRGHGHSLPADRTSARVHGDPAGDGENCKQHVDCCPCCCGTGTRRWKAGDLNPEALDVPLRGLLQGSHIFLFYLLS